MPLDLVLLAELETLVTGEAIHRFANLAGIYRSASKEAERTGAPEFQEIADEAERDLRSMLTDLRLKRAGLRP